ncbi:MAG: DUF1080 domain-containing protein [Chitinophagaceae bacterium]|nr:DUF1080 domain-containing protein [Chitinophagaceae bacterium]
MKKAIHDSIHLGSFTLLLLIAFSIPSFSQSKKPTLEGRWDLTIQREGKSQPSWLEVMHSGMRTWVGHFVGPSGSSRPVSRINIDSNNFSFAIPAQWEDGTGDLKLEASFTNEKISGTVTFPDGKNYPVTAVRAPKLASTVPQWGVPMKLFNGKDLTGWKALGENQWVVENGILRSPKSGANIRTEKTFTDFKLHIEFRYPKGSNSGVYLRGRYEVQIEDSKGVEPWIGGFGAVYGFIKPSEMPAKDAGEWQAYDITLVGRKVTVVANGKTIILNQEIPGITGGALDSNEGEPGPIYMQGDHGPIEYRNIIITPVK